MVAEIVVEHQKALRVPSRPWKDGDHPRGLAIDHGETNGDLPSRNMVSFPAKMMVIIPLNGDYPMFLLIWKNGDFPINHTQQKYGEFPES